MKETARINRQVLFNYKTYGRRHLYGGAIEQLNKNTITLPAYHRVSTPKVHQNSRSFPGFLKVDLKFSRCKNYSYI